MSHTRRPRRHRETRKEGSAFGRYNAPEIKGPGHGLRRGSGNVHESDAQKHATAPTSCESSRRPEARHSAPVLTHQMLEPPLGISGRRSPPRPPVRDGPVRCRRYDSDRSEDSVIATRTNASAPRPTYPDLSADPGPARWATPELPNRRGSGPEDGGRRSFAEHAALQVCVAGIWTEPDREQRASEVLARHPAADRALRRHLHARVGAPGE